MTIDDLSQSFQAELEAGKRPRIEKILGQMKEKYHERVLRSLLTVEIGYRRRGGESPNAEEYTTRFPDFEEVVVGVFEFLGPGPSRRPFPSSLSNVSMASMKVSMIGEGPVESPKRPSKPPEKKNASGGGDPEKKRPSRPAASARSNPARANPTRANPTATRTSGVSDATAYDEDLNSLLSVELPQEPRRKRTAAEINEAKERHERRKQRQKERDREERVRVKVGAAAIVPKAREPAAPLSEFQLPMIFLVASGLMNLFVAFLVLPEDWSLGFFLTLKAVFVLVSLVITTLALFAAAFVLGVQYGYLHSAILKMAAICLTQSWIAELYEWAPLPLVYHAASAISTYVLFDLFFELDPMDIVYSMIIVVVVRMMAYTYLWMVLIQLVIANPEMAMNIAQNLAPQEMEEEERDDPADTEEVREARETAQKALDKLKEDGTADDVPKPKEAEKGDPAKAGEKEADVDPAERPPVAKEVTGDAREAYQNFGTRYANLMIVEDLDGAYELTATEYREDVTLGDFKALQLDQRRVIGLPVSGIVTVEATDPEQIGRAEVAEGVEIPADRRLAHVAVRFKIAAGQGERDDLEAREVLHQLYLVSDGGKIRIAAIQFD